MLPPSDPEWTDVRPSGVSWPAHVPADGVYPTGTDRTFTLAATARMRTPKMAKVEIHRDTLITRKKSAR
jgi:hypothetical protein